MNHQRSSRRRYKPERVNYDVSGCHRLHKSSAQFSEEESGRMESRPCHQSHCSSSSRRQEKEQRSARSEAGEAASAPHSPRFQGCYDRRHYSSSPDRRTPSPLAGRDRSSRECFSRSFSPRRQDRRVVRRTPSRSPDLCVGKEVPQEEQSGTHLGARREKKLKRPTTLNIDKNYYQPRSSCYHYDMEPDSSRDHREVFFRDKDTRSPELSDGSVRNSDREYGREDQLSDEEYYPSEHEEEHEGYASGLDSRDMSVGSPASGRGPKASAHLRPGGHSDEEDDSPEARQLSKTQRRNRNRKRNVVENNAVISNLEAEVETLKAKLAEELEVRRQLEKLIRATQERGFINSSSGGSDEPLDEAMMVLRVDDDQRSASPALERVFWLPTTEQDFPKVMNFAEALAIARNKHHGQLVSNQLAALIMKANSGAANRDLSYHVKDEVTYVTVEEGSPMVQRGEGGDPGSSVNQLGDIQSVAPPTAVGVEDHHQLPPFNDPTGVQLDHISAKAGCASKEDFKPNENEGQVAELDLRVKINQARAARPRKMAKRTVVVVPHEQGVMRDTQDFVQPSADDLDQGEMVRDDGGGQRRLSRQGIKRLRADRFGHHSLDDMSDNDQTTQRCTRSAVRKDKQLPPSASQLPEQPEEVPVTVLVEAHSTEEEDVMLSVEPADTDFTME